MNSHYLEFHPDVATALAAGLPIVGLESTIIAHGLPWPHNLDCARCLEATVRSVGAVPATIGIVGGRIKIGLSEAELEHFAQADDIVKTSRRDLALVIARGSDGATTVASTMLCAHLAGIKVFATGGIGGVHRDAETSFDISADLTELGRTPIAVVCAGAKSILDLPKTLEVLETQGVPVIGYGSDEFPAFYVRSSGLPLEYKVDNAAQAAGIIRTQIDLGLASGMLFSVPAPADKALENAELEVWIEQALTDAARQNIIGKTVTPFLLTRVVELSEGRALTANLALVENNARVAAEIAKAYSVLTGCNAA